MLVQEFNSCQKSKDLKHNKDEDLEEIAKKKAELNGLLENAFKAQSSKAVSVESSKANCTGDKKKHLSLLELFHNVVKAQGGLLQEEDYNTPNVDSPTVTFGNSTYAQKMKDTQKIIPDLKKGYI